MASNPVIRIATRGSALALAQAHNVLAQCRQHFPDRTFELRIIKTTGDKKLGASLANPDPSLPKGLFTKELETALLEHQADLAVHSLKDLPTDLPAGLNLGAVSVRADVRDVLIYRDAGLLQSAAPAPAPALANQPPQPGAHGPACRIQDLPDHALLATSSTRRKAQLLDVHPRLQVVEIRGNVLTRLRKLASEPNLAATILAAAGLHRLHYTITPQGLLQGDDLPPDLRAAYLPTEVMLPCVGQAALGIEIREDDETIAPLCRQLNDPESFSCVTAERGFLQRMGGGCQSPVAAYATVTDQTLHLRAVSFPHGPPRRGEVQGPIPEALALGRALADRLR